MEWLLRVFYTVLSLSFLTALIAPVLLLIRFLLREHEKKYMMSFWGLIYLRSICPVALSSALCLIPFLNRRFHLFLAGLGLSITDKSGVMNSWRAVFSGKIETTVPFRLCSIFWAVGVVLVLLFALTSQIRLHRSLAAEKALGENIYESARIQTPVRLGWRKQKLYLPREVSSRELSWILKHMEYHHGGSLCRLVVAIITAIHWFNPIMWLFYYLWSMDDEMARDEKTVYHQKASVIQDYAQALLNFQKNSANRISFSIISVYERNTEKRAQRMMYQKWDTSRSKLSQLLVLSLTVIWLFLLVPLQAAWSGKTMNYVDTDSQSLFGSADRTVVSKVDTSSPEGLDRRIQLEMLSGSEEKSGYVGSFELAMYDSVGNLLASEKLEKLFPEEPENRFFFSKGLKLCEGDYNNDGVRELVLGQKQELTQKEFNELLKKTDNEAGTNASEDAGKVSEYQIYSYLLLNIEDKALEVGCDSIYSVSEEKKQSESKQFDVPEDGNTLFKVPFAKTEIYYIWEEGEKAYQQKFLTKEELAAYQKGEETTQQSGQTQEHTLESTDGTTQILVSTQKDDTGSEAIQAITLSPRNHSRKMEQLQGYFCDLFWVPTEETEKERYAMMIYNGTKSQTFVIYDTKDRELYYQHEDGSTMLQELFEQYDQGQISFGENSAAIYNVNEKKKDTLIISFAASAEEGFSVRGTYEYDVKEKISRNLTYSREVEDEESGSHEKAQ